MNVGLDGKALVITGAANGIGREIALHAAASGAEALLLVDRDEEGCRGTSEKISALSCETSFCLVDLADPKAPDLIAADALAKIGRIDGLVNSAGLTNRASVLDGTISDWELLFAVNARAPFFLMQAAIKDMISRGIGGTIVNILSMNAHCGIPELGIYSATKGALATLTKNAANAHLSDRIRVNGINLGWVKTDTEHRMQIALGANEDWADKAATTLPLGRLLQPGEAARLAIYLMSDASAPMTGVTLDLDQKVIGAL